jgi:DNA-binding IclR family transcriptional regulator
MKLRKAGMARSTSGESVLERAVRILEQFGPDAPELGVSALARRARLPLSTTHRLVQELTAHGLLERTDGRRLRVGVRLWELSLRSSRVLSIREAARPFMEDLHAVVRQNVSLGVLDGSDVLYLERLAARAAITNLTRVAGRLPAHAVSGGQVLLAYAARADREAVLAGPLARVTDRTVTEPAELRRVLATVRRTGYAIAAGHVEPTGTGVAAPIRRGDGAVVAALSLTVPLGHAARRVIPALLATTRGISRALGNVEPLDPAEVPSSRVGQAADLVDSSDG